MLKEWLTADEFPGLRVLCRPLRGPELLDLQVHGIRGRIVYEVIREIILDWENMPLIGAPDRVSEKFDLAILPEVRPDVALWIVTTVSQRMSALGSEERKNS